MERLGARNEYLDLVKGIAIVMVVAGHAIQYGSGALYEAEKRFYENGLFRAIYSFHMPLFMLVSGYLFAESAAKRGAGALIRSKVRSLGIPSAAWGTVNFVIGAARGQPATPKRYALAILNAPWFLWAALLCPGCFLALRAICGDRPWALFAGAVALLLVPDCFQIMYCKYLFPYFAAGYWWRVRDGRKWFERRLSDGKTRAIALTALAAVWLLLLRFFHREQYIYTSGMQILGSENPVRQLGIVGFRVLIGFAGSAMALVGASLIRPCGVLTALGRESLGVYLLNSYANVYLLAPIAAGCSHHPGLAAAETIAMLGICRAGARLLGRNRVTRVLFLGGRGMIKS